MTNEKIHFAFASNHAYMPGLKATAASILRASKDPTRLVYHVISDGLTEEDKSIFSRLCKDFGYTGEIDFRSQDLQYFTSRLHSFHGSHTAYARLHFPSVFSDLEWVVWTDIDVLWLRDPAELWDQKDDSVSLVWCRDFKESQDSSASYANLLIRGYDAQNYCCSGVMVMNLKRLRDRNFEARCDEFIREHGTPAHHDQDLLNLLCYGDTKIIDSKWDILDPYYDIKGGVVLHIGGVGLHFNRPFSHWHPAYEIWFRYYAQVIEGKVGAHVVSLKLRLLFTMLGVIRTPYWLCQMISALTLGRIKANNLCRPLYYCWLRRRLRW